jgi:hypothetical protein
MKNLTTMSAATMFLAFSANTLATPLDFWDTDGWTQIADDDGVGSGGYVDPGWGGQAFDAEYLYYKQEGSILYLGLQTGYDVMDGHYSTGGKDYYSGDLALSIDGGATYGFGVDFGLLTKSYNNGGSAYNPQYVDMGTDGGLPAVDGKDLAGLYSVTNWNNDIIFNQSSPFAIDSGELVASLLTNETNTTAPASGGSFFRTVSFDMTGTGLGATGTEIDLHWTMSCGNDAIDGSFTVPEPSLLSLMGLGLIGLGLARRSQFKA